MTLYLRSVKGIAGWIIAVCAVALLGWWLGSVTRPSPKPGKMEPVIITNPERIRQYYSEQVHGLEVGDPFPNITLWSADGSKAFPVRDILPKGGVLALLHTGCGPCRQSARAMQDALDSAGRNARPAVLITDVVEGTQSFADELANGGIRIPVYSDAESTLRLKYNVLGNFAYFGLDTTGLIRSIGFVIEPSLDEFLGIISNDSTRSTRGSIRESRI